MKIVTHDCPKCGGQLEVFQDGLVHCTGWVAKTGSTGTIHSQCPYKEPLPENLRLEQLGAPRMKGF